MIIVLIILYIVIFFTVRYLLIFCVSRKKLCCFTGEIEFEIPDATNISTYVGEREKLKCEAHGYPPPTITWSFNSSEAKPSEEPKILKYV